MKHSIKAWDYNVFTEVLHPIATTVEILKSARD